MKAKISEKVETITNLLQTNPEVCEPVEALLSIVVDEESGIVTADEAEEKIMVEVRILGRAFWVVGGVQEPPCG